MQKHFQWVVRVEIMGIIKLLMSLFDDPKGCGVFKQLLMQHTTQIITFQTKPRLVCQI